MCRQMCEHTNGVSHRSVLSFFASDSLTNLTYFRDATPLVNRSCMSHPAATFRSATGCIRLHPGSSVRCQSRPAVSEIWPSLALVSVVAQARCGIPGELG